MERQMIGVIGAGQMGHGIAKVAATAGFQVILCDLDYKILEGAIDQITQNLNEEVKQGIRTEWLREKILKHITISTQLEELAGCYLIIEATPEKEEIKVDVFEALDNLCPPETVFASNTSSISITRLGASTCRPHQFIGIHFISPVATSTLVEVVPGLETSNATLELAQHFVKKLGKAVVLAKDFPGFIGSRILIPMINEAIFTLSDGVATAEEIDRVLMEMGHEIGPLAMADRIGLDTCLDVMEVLYTEFCDDKYRPAPLIRKYVEAGWLGQKTQRGFYDYSEPS